MTSFCAAVTVAAAVAVVYETEMLCPGGYAGEDFVQVQFVLTAAMELLTVVCIPLALRLFKMLGRKVHDAATLRRYGLLRLAMLVVPLWLNTILYYLFMNAAFGYMAIIILIAMSFVFPTKDRCRSEEEHVV